MLLAVVLLARPGRYPQTSLGWQKPHHNQEGGFRYVEAESTGLAAARSSQNVKQSDRQRCSRMGLHRNQGHLGFIEYNGDRTNDVPIQWPAQE